MCACVDLHLASVTCLPGSPVTRTLSCGSNALQCAASASADPGHLLLLPLCMAEGCSAAACQVNLDKLVAEAVDVSAQMVKAGVTLEKRAVPGTPPITGDKKRLMQILHNLASGAIASPTRLLHAEIGHAALFQPFDTCHMDWRRCTAIFDLLLVLIHGRLTSC